MSHPLRTRLRQAISTVLVLSVVASGVHATTPEPAARSGDAGELVGHAVDAGLDAGLQALRDSGLPFLGSLQGGVVYDTALRRLDYDVLALYAFHGDGAGHHWLLQLGAHNLRDRRTANAGLVYRWVDPEGAWLLGTNLFYDHDFDAHARRAGLGVEAMSPTLRVFANGYAPLDGWGVAPGTPRLEERPARGYDLGLAWTPRPLSILDLQLKGARWLGDAVDVFATGQPEVDPTVWSARATVRPVSALRVGFEQSRIVGGAQDFQASVTWVHQFGVPLSRQWRWDGNGRGTGNDLAQRALLPVEREKRLVMDTRERGVPLVLATDAVQAQVVEGEAFEHVVAVTGGALPLAYALRGADAALFELSGDTLRLPAQDASAPADAGADNVYDVVVVVTDGHGRTALQPVAVTVLPAGTPDAAGTAPTASPRVTGDLVVGRTVRGEVHFADVDGDAEGEHDYQWYLAVDPAGEVRFPIPGATAATHAITERDEGAYLVFEVTPRSATGTPATGVPTHAVSGRVNSTPYVNTIGASHPDLVVGAEIELSALGLADLDGDPVTATFALYRADDDADTASRVLIEDGVAAVGYRYRIQAADLGKVLVLEVTPSSTQGSSPGEPVRLKFRVPAANP